MSAGFDSDDKSIYYLFVCNTLHFHAQFYWEILFLAPAFHIALYFGPLMIVAAILAKTYAIKTPVDPALERSALKTKLRCMEGTNDKWDTLRSCKRKSTT